MTAAFQFSRLDSSMAASMSTSTSAFSSSTSAFSSSTSPFSSSTSSFSSSTSSPPSSSSISLYMNNQFYGLDAANENIPFISESRQAFPYENGLQEFVGSDNEISPSSGKREHLSERGFHVHCGKNSPPGRDVVRYEVPRELSFKNLHELSESKKLFTDVQETLAKIYAVVNKIRKIKNDINVAAQEQMTSIKNTTQRIILTVQRREKELIADVKKISALKLNSLCQQEIIYNSLLDRLHRTQNALATAHGNRSIKDLLSAKDQATAELNQIKPVTKNLRPFEDEFCTFVPPDEKIYTDIMTIGSIFSSAYAPFTVASGEGLIKAVKGQKASFKIYVKNHLSIPMMCGGDQVEVEIKRPDENTCDVLVHDANDGSYNVEYTPAMAGRHTIRVMLRGQAIFGSPFYVNVRVFRNYSRVGTPILVFGSCGSADGQLRRPWGVCCDHEGNIIVADRSNNRIQIFRPDGTFLLKFGSEGNERGQFNRPAGVAVDNLNRIIVADKDNHRIQVFTLTGKFLLTFGEFGEGNGQFQYPWDVAVNQENQIAVTDTRNHRIQLFAHDGQYLAQYGYENYGSNVKDFDSPRGICFDNNGNINLTDFNKHRLVMINYYLTNACYLGYEGVKARCFKRPQGIVVDTNGNIIVADSKNHRIQIFGPDGSFMKQFGRQGTLPGEMDVPCGICLSPDGKIIVVDYENNRIQVF